MNQSVVDNINQRAAARLEACLQLAEQLPELPTKLAPPAVDLSPSDSDCAATEALSGQLWAFSDQLLGLSASAADPAVSDAYLWYSIAYADYASSVHSQAVLCMALG